MARPIRSCALSVALLAVGATALDAQARGRPAQGRGRGAESMAPAAGLLSANGLSPQQLLLSGRPQSTWMLYAGGVDAASWCEETVTVHMLHTQGDASAAATPMEGNEAVFREAWDRSDALCRPVQRVGRVNVELMANGVVLRRVWVTGTSVGSLFPYFGEVFAESDYPNPSGERLATSGLEFESFFDNVFHGRFDRVRELDPRGFVSATAFVHFTLAFGEKYPQHLPGSVDVLRRTVEEGTLGGATVRSERQWAVDARMAESILEAADAHLVFGLGGLPFVRDYGALLARHEGDSAALWQLMENLHRNYTQQPPVQQTSRSTR